MKRWCFHRFGCTFARRNRVGGLVMFGRAWVAAAFLGLGTSSALAEDWRFCEESFDKYSTAVPVLTLEPTGPNYTQIRYFCTGDQENPPAQNVVIVTTATKLTGDNRLNWSTNQNGDWELRLSDVSGTCIVSKSPLQEQNTKRCRLEADVDRHDVAIATLEGDVSQFQVRVRTWARAVVAILGFLPKY